MSQAIAAQTGRAPMLKRQKGKKEQKDTTPRTTATIPHVTTVHHLREGIPSKGSHVTQEEWYAVEKESRGVRSHLRPAILFRHREGMGQAHEREKASGVLLRLGLELSGDDGSLNAAFVGSAEDAEETALTPVGVPRVSNSPVG